jgi:hypothetical protein
MIGTWALKALGQSVMARKVTGGQEIKDRRLARTEQWILVRCRHSLELPRPGIIAEPSPPTTLNASGGCIHLFLKLIDRAKVALERHLQLAVFELAAALLYRHEVLPEQGVVDVAFVQML